MGPFVDGIAFAGLLTSLYVLRFRGWRRPIAVVVYFAFFFALEFWASSSLIPPGAFGPWLAIACFGLTVPVLVAAGLVWRHERTQQRAE